MAGERDEAVAALVALVKPLAESSRLAWGLRAQLGKAIKRVESFPGGVS